MKVEVNWMAINTNTQKQTSNNRNAEETKSFMEKAYNQAEQELEKYLNKIADENFKTAIIVSISPYSE